MDIKGKVNQVKNKGIVTPDRQSYMLLGGNSIDLDHMDYVHKVLDGESTVSDVFVSEYDQSVLELIKLRIRQKVR